MQPGGCSARRGRRHDVQGGWAGGTLCGSAARAQFGRALIGQALEALSQSAVKATTACPMSDRALCGAAGAKTIARTTEALPLDPLDTGHNGILSPALNDWVDQ